MLSAKLATFPINLSLVLLFTTALNSILRTLAGVDGGETPHSFRAGCSITLQLLGVSKPDVAKHLGWRSSNMVDHYNDLEKIVKPGHTAEVLSSSTSSQASSATQDMISSYQAFNELKDFKPVFPSFVFLISFTNYFLSLCYYIGSLLPITYPCLGRLGVRAPGENLLLLMIEMLVYLLMKLLVWIVFLCPRLKNRINTNHDD